MGLRTILKTAGHWLKGSIVKVDSEIQFDTTTNPEIDSTGGDFVWNTQTSSANSWKLRDPGTTEDIIITDTDTKTFTLHSSYTASGFYKFNTIAKAINYTAVDNDFVLVTTGVSTINITLPSAAIANQQISVKKIDAAVGIVDILTFGAETIDGNSNQQLADQYAVITLISDGSEWFVKSAQPPL